jgi:hypothetical protein
MKLTSLTSPKTTSLAKTKSEDPRSPPSRAKAGGGVPTTRTTLMSAKIDNTIQRHATRKEMARRWHLDFVWNDPEMRAIRDDPDVWHELVVEAKLSENPEQRLAELRQGLGDKIIDQVSGLVGDPDDDEGDDE